MEVMKCKRCGGEWYRRQLALPLKCAKCGSPYWNKDYQVRKKPRSRAPKVEQDVLDLIED